MIVKYHDHDGPDDDPYEHDHRDVGMYHGGCVSGWMEKTDEPSRPIGFRLEKSEDPPSDPSWMLI